VEKVVVAVDSSNKLEHQRQEVVETMVVERAADFQKSTAVVVQTTDTMQVDLLEKVAVVVQATDTMQVDLLEKVVVVWQYLAEVCHMVMGNP